jgi:ABC-type nitrate/sulfonate/bicarbonate transport system substrate-binding protein
MSHAFRVPLRAAFACALALVVGCLVESAAAAKKSNDAPVSVAGKPPAVLRVNVFPTASYAPLYLGIADGIFEKHGIRIDLQFTPNSDAQREGLAKGAFEIAHAAVDNAVAMVELAHEDVIIVSGGDTGMNEFIARPEVQSLADMRGRTLIVDAPNTAYGLLAKKILKNAGLLEGKDYKLRPIGGTPQRLEALQKDPDAAAAMLNPPFSFVAKDKGLKSFGRATDLLGPYQASGAFVMRKWARANGALLESYLAACIESFRLAMDPANRAQVVSLLASRLKQDSKVAERTYDVLMQPGFGLAPDAKFSREGFKAVLALRAEIEGQWDGKPPSPKKYVDLRYYYRALKSLDAKQP